MLTGNAQKHREPAMTLDSDFDAMAKSAADGFSRLNVVSVGQRHQLTPL
jgi:hypothetical protein